jgi:hypothetical protein
MATKIFSPDGSTLYLSGAPIYQMGTNYVDDQAANSTYIFANHCTVPPGTIKCTELHVHAASIAVSSGNVVLDSAGTNGVQNDTINDTSANATNAYPLSLSTPKFDHSNPLMMQATGGNGGTGFSPPDTTTAPGTGGNAGNGANVTLLVNTDYDNVADTALTIINDTTRTPDQKIDDMTEWEQYAQFVTTPNAPDSISWVYYMKIDQSQPDMDPNSPLPHAINAKTFLGLMAVTVNVLRQTASDFMSRVDCQAGKPGHGGAAGVTGKKGPDGAEGKPGVLSYGTFTETGVRNSTDMLFHPDQVAQTIRDIENSYYIGTKDSVNDARTKLDTLIDHLGLLQNVAPDDPIYKAYAANEYPTLAVLSSSGSDTPGSIVTLKANLQIAQQYKLQIDQGYDFYQHVSTWVPRASYTFYADELTQLLADFDSIETNYDAYQKAAASDSDRAYQVQNALAAARAGERLTNADIKILAGDLTDTAANIAVLQEEIPPKHKAVDDMMTALGDKIKQAARWPSTKEVLGALGQMAFCASPEQAAAMGTIQAGTLVNSSLTEVVDSQGNPVPKGYVIDQINTLKAGLDGLNEAVEESANEPGLDVDDPGATKLLGQEQDIMDLLNQYRDTLGDDVDDFKAVLDDYVNTILQRNNQVIQYNSTISLYIKAKAQLDSYTHDEAILASQDERLTNSVIPSLANTVKGGFLAYTSKVLQLLYETQRALMFWSLDSGTVDLSILRDQGFPSPGLGDSLKTAKGDIIKDFSDATESLSVGRQPYGVAGGPTGQAKVVELNQWQLQQLKMTPFGTEYFSTFTVPVATSTMSVQQSPFASMADVRVSTVRAYLEGAKTDDGILHLSLQHLGDEKIVTVHNEVVHFTHDRLPFAFEYNMVSKDITVDGNIGADPNFALVGPFATWRIGASTLANKNLDLSNVTRAWFEFSGYSRSYR